MPLVLVEAKSQAEAEGGEEAVEEGAEPVDPNPGGEYTDAAKAAGARRVRVCAVDGDEEGSERARHVGGGISIRSAE